MKKIAIILAAVLAVCSCGISSRNAESSNYGFPKVNQNGKIAIVAHRGFWNCEAAGFSENSIASLKAAQDNGFWGSEFDVQLTKDEVVIVNHNDDIDGLKIKDHTFAELSSHLLPNGERRPTLEEYLEQGRKCKTTMLVLEFKKQSTDEREDILVAKTIQALKAYKLFDPRRVAFISFSKHISEMIAKDAPRFINQYLNGELSPEALAAKGINGFDYHKKIVGINKKWVEQAHAKGMSTNVWTVNAENEMLKMIEIGVDAITTNEPLLLRSKLGDRECTR